MFWSKNKKNINIFLVKFSIFGTEKNEYIAKASFRNEKNTPAIRRSLFQGAEDSVFK